MSWSSWLSSQHIYSISDAIYDSCGKLYGKCGGFKERDGEVLIKSFSEISDSFIYDCTKFRISFKIDDLLIAVSHSYAVVIQKSKTLYLICFCDKVKVHKVTLNMYDTIRELIKLGY